jgi:transposase
LNYDGQVIGSVQLPVSQPSCQAFAGPTQEQLYITTAQEGLNTEQPSAGSLYIVETGIAGLAEPTLRLEWTTYRPALNNKAGLRRTVEGILFRMRTGIPWRDLPEHFGKWNSIYKAFNHWSKKGIWKKLFSGLTTDSNLELVFIDGRDVKAHHHSAGAAAGHDEHIGKSRAGNTSKVHLAINAKGLSHVFTITGGHINDCTEAPALIKKIEGAQILIADKGYDSQTIRAEAEALGMSVIIPRKKNSIKGNKGLDWQLYKLRHLVENAFARLKHCRAVAIRYDKLARNYESIVSLACAFLWLPM